MCVSREEFLAVVQSSKTKGEAARRLGISDQSVWSRIDRIKRNDMREAAQKARRMPDEDLEAAWSEAVDECNQPLADVYFDEMCKRLEFTKPCPA